MLQFGHTQLPIRFRNRALAMDPFGLDPIEPGALNRQGTHHHATATGLLDVPVVRFEPGPHGLADVPRGVVPDQQQGGFAFGGQPRRQPREKPCRHRPPRPPIDEAAEPAWCSGTSQPITRDRRGLWGMPIWLVVEQA
jgi:hypothetical protein